MRIRYFILSGIVLVIVYGCADLWAQSAKTEKTPASSVMQEMENYPEAMSWFRKGEDMIDTDRENSDEQAEMFLKAIELWPEFLQAHYNLGLIYINRNKMKEAAEEFETVLHLSRIPIRIFTTCWALRTAKPAICMGPSMLLKKASGKNRKTCLC